MTVNKKLRDPVIDRLFEAILNLENIDECYALLEDLCTINELKAMAQRFAVAEMLDQGKTYEDITAVTGASAATISRVNRCLHYGADGYRQAIDRLKNK
jgi:TrpR-related protein YerC/YecD